MCPEGNAGSLPFIWVRFRNRTLRCLPPLPARRPMREPHISPKGRKVYMAFQPARFIRSPICIGKPCALTAHFHPYPEKSGRLFSVTLSVPRPLPRPHRLGGAVLCVVRTFLPSPREKAAERFARLLEVRVTKYAYDLRSTKCESCAGIVLRTSEPVLLKINWHDFLVFRVAIVRVLFLYICTARKKPFLDPCHPVCPENIPGVGSTFQIV